MRGLAKILATLVTGMLLFLPQGKALPVVHKAEISEVNGFILLHASLNGNPGIFIFDTGAPGLVLNKEKFGNERLETTTLVGAQGIVEATILKTEKLVLQNLELQTPDAFVLDLSYLQDATGKEIDGLIGLSLFDGYELLIDLKSGYLSISKRKGQLEPEARCITMALRAEQHLPVVNLKIGDAIYRFGLDTGSKSNLLCRSAASRMPENRLEMGDLVSLTSAGQHKQILPSISLNIHEADDGSMSQMDFIITNFDGLAESAGVDIDGILGYTFFNDRVIYFDKRREEIRISVHPHEQFVLASR